MLFDSPAVERLVEAFRRLPGVGKRSAERYALHVLSAPAEEARLLSDAVRDAREKITTCSVCCTLTETDPCTICANTSRDHSLICVVERTAGIIAIEKGGGYRGLYHVLNGAINPLDGIGPDELTIETLVRRVSKGDVSEVIVATNATAEGESTALYLARRLNGLGVTVTRIAHGVPMGGGLELADGLTLSHALQGRTKLG
ncbi:MAG TPA: recombination mediator RecR [Candidatus Hydrogenedentes bacterium]|nr:recombination mediator RecR [Candidatus Hydrogenedentota bacterium]